jgi:histidine triad (HIT) family protein
MDKTIFQKIIEKEIPSDIIFEDELCIVIKDINPQAPIHLLIIPKKPIPKLADASKDDLEILGHLMLIVGNMSRQFNVEDAFNVIINNGEKAGQTVFHLHIHLLAGNTKLNLPK